jgi:hypothetical protein
MTNHPTGSSGSILIEYFLKITLSYQEIILGQDQMLSNVFEVLNRKKEELDTEERAFLLGAIVAFKIDGRVKLKRIDDYIEEFKQRLAVSVVDPNDIVH